jgi:hypothetical protein
MPVQCMQMTCYIYVASSWNESSCGAVHADDLLYLCSIFLELKFMPVQYMQMTFLYLCSILLERQLMPVQCMQMTCYIYVASSWNDSSCQCSTCRWPFISMWHLPGTAAHASAVHADDLLYLCSIFLERQLMPVQCMQMTFYIYVASSWNGSSCQCSTCRWPIISM